MRKLTSEVDVRHFSFVVPALARIVTVLYTSEHEADRIAMAAEMIQDARESGGQAAGSQTQTIVTLSEDEIRTRHIQVGDRL